MPANRIAVTGRQKLYVGLGFEESDRSVGEAYIQQRKETRALFKWEMPMQRGSLCDLVPEVLDVAVPEPSYLGLFRGAGSAVYEAETFHFIEDLSIRSLVSAGGGPGRNTSARVNANGVTWGHWVKSAGAKLGGVNW